MRYHPLVTSKETVAKVVFVGVVAGAGVALWVNFGGKAELPTAKDGAPRAGSVKAGAPPRTGKIDLPPPRSRVEAPDAAVADASSAPSNDYATRFAAEKRDPTWARATEVEVSKRLKRFALGGNATVECKDTLCDVTVSQLAKDDVAAMLAKLETPDGFVGYAANISLDDVHEEADGTSTLTFHTRFARGVR